MDLTANRRQVLAGAAAVVGASTLAAGSAHPASAHGSDTATPFPLGVASGDPLPDSVILWTRLIRDRRSSRPVEVSWQVAKDDRFRRVVRSGKEWARPELAHSVHVDARGLEPGREYFYRFKAEGQLSPVGRTRTAPHRHARPDHLRFGVASCQDLQNGYWPAYWGLADEDFDVVFHLGDYIYEYDPNSRFADRRHTSPRRSVWTNCAHWTITATGTHSTRATRPCAPPTPPAPGW
ncbi:alkaline phosphatase D family protein [Phytohabitans flavus]|uniref:alkaline phosphatase D family protein n=1 Tax=Phytohabitans flavus TaxID=1076124 RepID=UPI0036348634